MKRTISLLATAAVVATPLLADAAPKKKVERKVTTSYTLACQAGVDGANGGITGCPNELEDAASKTESYVKFSAVDTTGRPIGIVAYNPDDYGNTATNYCGGITKAIKIKPGTAFGVKTIVDPTCGAAPTTGTITIIFSNLP
jgi:hypothetical protein